MKFQSIRLPIQMFLLLCLAVPALLAGCGGGGGGGGANVPPSPFAGQYAGTVTTGNDNRTTAVTFTIDAGGTISTVFPINNVNQTFSAPLGNVDAQGNFQTEVQSPARVIFTGTIKPEVGTGIMRIDGSFFIPSTGLRGTFTAKRL